MSTSVDGFIADRNDGFAWGAPSQDLLAFHLARVRELGGFLCGRRLCETMLVREDDPATRGRSDSDELIDVWTVLPTAVFSRTVDRVQGNTRLAATSLAKEASGMAQATEVDTAIGGATLAAGAIKQGHVDGLRCPGVVGGGRPHLPPVTLDLIETKAFGSRRSDARLAGSRGGGRRPPVERAAKVDPCAGATV